MSFLLQRKKFPVEFYRCLKWNNFYLYQKNLSEFCKIFYLRQPTGVSKYISSKSTIFSKKVKFILATSWVWENVPKNSSHFISITSMITHDSHEPYLLQNLLKGINPFSTSVSLPYPLKKSSNIRFSYVFRGYRSGILVENVLITFIGHIHNLLRIYKPILSDFIDI